jgi:hypothetical protein
MAAPPASARHAGSAPGSGAGHPRNAAALVGLGCGLACLVPWVVLLTFPLALVFGVIGLVRSTRLPGREGRAAACIGMAVAVAAAILQLALAGLASLVGLLLG